MPPLSPELFGQLAQGMGAFVLFCALISGIAFVRDWGWRFRMVGVTSFCVVLTVGLFALSLEPFTTKEISGAAPYAIVYDRLGTEAVIKVQPEITADQLESTLEQAAFRLFTSGRGSDGGRSSQLRIRARTVLHPQPGVSQPLYLGEIKRSLRVREDPNMQITLYPNELIN
ncbi:Protein of unknown function DUF2518 [Thalassoporum mexicanum PCC 7367]|uniref:Ycf51 family protein n=1 Tax=Thalassoporum mexicanum TaxID=3457544 RepID=UPI00029FEDFB|nr:Ycf51 family protein [Pseudanabaena sp. PCC 7367]AFY69575.1 Protein of unknown function DUF2518 [Pseudanabaena sp. PCC 7367]